MRKAPDGKSYLLPVSGWRVVDLSSAGSCSASRSLCTVGLLHNKLDGSTFDLLSQAQDFYSSLSQGQACGDAYGGEFFVTVYCTMTFILF